MTLVLIEGYKKKSKKINTKWLIILPSIPVLIIVGYFSVSHYRVERFERCCNKICKRAYIGNEVIACHDGYVWCQWDRSATAYQMMTTLTDDLKKWSAENGNVIHEPCDE